MLAGLVAMLGLRLGGEGSAMLARGARTRGFRLLKPLESAVRRLIVLAARDLPVPEVAPARRRADRPESAGARRVRGFPMDDRRKGFLDQAPREPWTFEPRDPAEPVDAAGLWARLAAVRAALTDLDGHALRMARRAARRASSGRLGPVARGRPPGLDLRRGLEIDRVLDDLHRRAIAAPDTS